MAEVSDEELAAALEEAVRVAVLQEQSRVGGARYRFAHAFFRQTLYEELITPRRLRLHQQVARAMEAQYWSRLDEHAAEMAEHFAQSTDPVDLRKAIDYAELAAARALGVFAYGEAARHLEQAIGVQEVLDPRDKAKRCDLLLALGDAWLPAGEPLRLPDEIAAAALALAEELGDQQRSSRACLQALDGMRRYGIVATINRPEYLHWTEDADRYAAPGSLDRVRVDLALGRRLGSRDRDDEAWVLEQSALELARTLGDPETIYRAASYILEGPWPATHLHDQIRTAEEFSGRGPAGVGAGTLGLLLQWSGHVFLSSGNRARAEEVWRRAAQLSERTRDSYLILGPQASQAILALLDGRLEQAIEGGQQIQARAEDLGIAGFGRQLGGQVALYARLYLGRSKETLAAALELPGLRDLRSMNPAGAAVYALCLAHLGRHVEAREILSRFHPGGGAATVTLSLRNDIRLLEAAVQVQDGELARLSRDRLADVAGNFSDWSVTCVARHLAAASALLREPENARGYYEQALAVSAEVGARPDLALTHMQLAELLLDHHPDERASAIDHLDFAIGEFREMKMQPSLERALRHKEVLKA